MMSWSGLLLLAAETWFGLLLVVLCFQWANGLAPWEDSPEGHVTLTETGAALAFVGLCWWIARWQRRRIKDANEGADWHVDSITGERYRVLYRPKDRHGRLLVDTHTWSERKTKELSYRKERRDWFMWSLASTVLGSILLFTDQYRDNPLFTIVGLFLAGIGGLFLIVNTLLWLAYVLGIGRPFGGEKVLDPMPERSAPVDPTPQAPIGTIADEGPL